MTNGISFRQILSVKMIPVVCFLLFFSIINPSASKANKDIASDEPLEPVIIQLKWFSQFQFAGYYAALHKGFFQEEGLDVTIRAGGPQTDVAEEVSSGRANFGILASELIQKKAQGEPLVLLAVIMQHSIRAIIVRADSAIDSPADLINQHIMLNKHEDTEFMAMFIAEGIPIKKLNIIQKDRTANNKFISGEIDALNGSIGNQPFLFQSKGIPVKTIRPISYGIDFYGDSLFTSKSELKNHPKRVEGFRKATLRGWEYAMAHPNEIIDLIIDKYHSPKSRDHLQFEAEKMRKLILPGLVDIGHINPKRIERIARIYAEHNLVPKNFSLEGFVYNPVPGPNKKLIGQLITGFIIFAGIVLLGMTLLIIFNKRLKKLVDLQTHELAQANESLIKEVEIRTEAEKSLRSIVESTVGVTGQDLYDKIVRNLTKLFNCDIAIVGEITESSEVKALSMEIDGEIVRDYSHELIGAPCENAVENGFCVYPEHVSELFPDDHELKNMQVVGYVGTPLIDNNAETIGVLCAMSRSKLDLPKESEGLIKIMAARASAEIQRRRWNEIQAATEMKLRQAQKMEAIGTLAGGIAHDFNNILGAIIGYADMAREDTPANSTVANDLDKVLEAGNRAKDLVKQILAFSRQDDAERLPLQPAIIIKEAIKMLRSSMPTTIHIFANIDSMSGMIFADPTQFHQIVMNLCTNAFHAMEKTGGELYVTLRNVKEYSENLPDELALVHGKFVELIVRDTGSGINPSNIDKIFQPYFTTKETGKGTGMGLAITHGIIKKWGGAISVNSKLGTGTTFRVMLPMVENDIIEKEKSTEPVHGGQERILLVDDEEILAKIGQDMLERLGYHVTVRTNSLAALESFQNQPDQYDLVITDQTMPGMTGADLARRMIQIRPNIPIILCTGYSSIMSEEKAKAIGIKEFAFKPLTKTDIAKLTRKVLDTDSSTTTPNI